ncbi:MAG: inositol monophosphatase family protein [Gammaproteobacteria bacterium]
MHPFLSIATRAARKAGSHIMRAYERLEDVKVSSKGENDYVTEVDRKSEEIIMDTLSKFYPTHGFLGEESGDTIGHDNCRWIIDPLDGTTNFIHGYPNFCISIAYEEEGRIEHGLIYDPIRDTLFTATRGSGAFCNDKRMRVRNIKLLPKSLVTMSFNKTELTPEHIQKMTQLTIQAGAIRRSGSAALDLAHVAAGYADGCVQWGMQLWDIAAGTLMISEAGGVVVGLEGDNFLSTGSFVASNLKLMPALQAVLRD